MSMSGANSPSSPTCGWVFVPEFLSSSLERETKSMAPLWTQTLSSNWEWKRHSQKASCEVDDLGETGWIKTSVPTDIFRDLLVAGKIKDPHLDRNEMDVQWIGESDWAYRTQFRLDHSLEHGGKVVLAFEGLDSFAKVYFNGTLILESENMFHEHRVEITSLVSSTKCNGLEIIFESALKRGRAEVAKRGSLALWNGEASRLYVRKAQYHWGWDWGPVMMSAGPWKPIRLEIYHSRIGEVAAPIKLAEDLKSATIDYAIELESPPGKATVEIEISGPLKGQSTKDRLIHRERLEASTELKGSIEVNAPSLWYPVNYGSQPLYILTVKLLHNDTILDTKSHKLAFRRVELIQSSLKNQPGNSFYLKINNIPIFCAGSNWIPADTILTRISPSRYKTHFSLLLHGNQNMLRVWGGGIYESEDFYDLADDFGILIWQDFMFACGQYPGHSEFLDSVRREAVTQVKRLRWHPSVALFAGNNEDYVLAETSKLKWDPKERDPEKWLKTEFPARYIYEKILPEVCLEHAPGIPYHPGSPFGGEDSSNSPTIGDIHQWNVWHGEQRPYQDYPQLSGRFVSEFGMQALPSLRTINQFVTSKQEYYPQSCAMDHHNKASGFEMRLNGYLLSNYRLHSFTMREYVHQTQRMQADALSEAFRSWRRLWQGPEKEYNSGALVWQLNDCWPCTSWSIVDYFLRPKLSWYAISRELRPVTFGISRLNEMKGTGKQRNARFEVWGVNSTLDSVDVNLTIEFYSISSGARVSHVEQSTSLLPNQSTEVWSETDYSSPDLLDTVISVLYSLPNGETMRSAANWPRPLKYIDFSNRELTFTVNGEEVSITADKPVRGVILDIAGDDDSELEWSDNGLDVMPGDMVKVTAKGLNGRTVKVNWYGNDFGSSILE